MDRVSLRALECYGYHGVFPEENRLGQRFIIDLDLDLCLKTAGEHDDLYATVNYAEIADRVKHIVEGPSYKLIETVAEKIAQMLLQTYPLLQEVHVHVTKPHPPVAFSFKGVVVSIHRKRVNNSDANL
jgi:dihydroneopterin aldolase